MASTHLSLEFPRFQDLLNSGNFLEEFSGFSGGGNVSKIRIENFFELFQFSRNLGFKNWLKLDLELKETKVTYI